MGMDMGMLLKINKALKNLPTSPPPLGGAPPSRPGRYARICSKGIRSVAADAITLL